MMKFRPCIDIHNGQVKQIVGGSLQDKGDSAEENFVSERDAAWYAGLYRKDGIKGGHVILLNGKDSPWYEKTKEQALSALRAYPMGLAVGGGVTDENAGEYLRAGASHVIVTSYVFDQGKIRYDRLKKLVFVTGKDRLILDLSCRKRNSEFYVVTNRWQTFTEEKVTGKLLEDLSDFCDEFLIHGVDVEGKGQGIDTDLLAVLSSVDVCPVTYAGGVHSYEDIETIRTIGRGKIDFTVGSALDLFGGKLSYEKLVSMQKMI